MKTLFLILLGLMGAAPKPVLPRTVDEAVERISATLKPEDREKLLAMKREDVIMYHHGWGTGIRNEFGLWQAESPLRDDCAKRQGVTHDKIHPDDCSMIIMEAVWDRAHRP